MAACGAESGTARDWLVLPKAATAGCVISELRACFRISPAEATSGIGEFWKSCRTIEIPRSFRALAFRSASPPANHHPASPEAWTGQATMTPTLLSQPAPLSPASPAAPRADCPVRLSLRPVQNRRAVVDGAWWPSSRDAAAELPGLIAAVDRLLDRATLRIGLHGDAWQNIPRRIPARGRQVRIGWFRHTDPRVLTLSFAADEPVVLLIIPSGTAAGTAEATLKLTAQDIAGMSIDAILTLAHLPAGPAARATADGSARWEDEGGPVIGQAAQPSMGRRAPSP
ncbi:DUF5994 family protein [Nonomuraea sp. NPDC049504]|uniref:DUF5994 family protein n=1 Tax=Nonomuraea sp. NPDC049504 TaxID=3154729 RepID=UPI00343E883E